MKCKVQSQVRDAQSNVECTVKYERHSELQDAQSARCTVKRGVHSISHREVRDAHSSAGGVVKCEVQSELQDTQ